MLRARRTQHRDMPSNQSKPLLPSQGSTCFERWQPMKSRFTQESLGFLHAGLFIDVEKVKYLFMEDNMGK